MTVANVLVDGTSIPLPFPASTAVAIGDLLWWDATNKLAKPAALVTPGASEAADQATFAPIFCGIAGDVRLASETDVGGIRRVVTEGVFDADCVSGYTPALGDLVSVTRNGGSALVSQMVTHTSVTKTTAIGVVIGIPTQTGNASPWGAVQTKVRVRFKAQLCTDVASHP